MGRELRQSTVQTITFGPVLQPDGLTAYTAGGFAVKVGMPGTLAARHDATAIAHIADGNYAIELDATDTATAGPGLRVALAGSSGSYLPAWEDFAVLSGPVYDALFGASALQTVAAAVTLPASVPSGYATSANQTSILNAVDAITTNTARGKAAVPSFLARPSSGSATYEVDLSLYNLQGQSEAPDAAPTVHARDASGTSRDAALGSTTMTLIATGRYKVTFAVASTDATGEIFLDFSWAVGGVAFSLSDATIVEDAESLSALAAIQAQTDKLAFDGSGNVKSAPQTAATVGGYAAGQDPASLVLATPANKLATDAAGKVGANNLPADYQQRGVAVTLPSTPPAGYGTLTLPSGTVGSSPSALSISATMAGLGTGSPLKGRRLLYQTGTLAGTLTDGCSGCTISGTTAIFTFATAQAVPAQGDTFDVVGF